MGYREGEKWSRKIRKQTRKELNRVTRQKIKSKNQERGIIVIGNGMGRSRGGRGRYGVK